MIRTFMKRQQVRLAILIVSFLVFPATFYYLSPYLIVDAASKGIINGSFLFFALLLISSLILGRGFCGWVCPAGGIQEFIAKVNSRYVKKGNTECILCGTCIDGCSHDAIEFKFGKL